MTIDEMLKHWKEESDAANDIIISVLETYMEFVDLVEMHAETRNEPILLALAKRRKECWTPILEHAKKAKEKANEQSKTTE